MSLVEIAIKDLQPDPEQPRKNAAEVDLHELAASMKNLGQLVPIIVVIDGDRKLILDGWRRWLAAQECGLTSLRALPLASRPTPAEMLTMQLVVNCTRSDLSVYERFQAYNRLMELENLSGTELAKRLSVSKGTVTRVLSIGSLSKEIQELVRDAKISSANAYALARMSAHDQELALQGLSEGSKGRVELERLAKKKKQNEDRSVSRVVCELPGCSVLVRGQEPMSLDGMIEVFENLIRLIRKARKEGYDVPTLSQVLRVTAGKPLTKETQACSGG